jgi:four helix bundle protein
VRKEKYDMMSSEVKQKWRYEFSNRLLKFSVTIILLADKLPKTPAGFAIAQQIVRSGTSIGANFIEAQDASSLKDFIQKLSISLREARETEYWLKVCKDTPLLEKASVEIALSEGNEIIAILVDSIKSAKKKLQVTR